MLSLPLHDRWPLGRAALTIPASSPWSSAAPLLRLSLPASDQRGAVPEVDPTRLQSYTDVGEFYASSVAQYVMQDRKNNPPICQMSPVRDVQGMTTDATGTLYVAEDFNHGTGVGTFTPFGSARRGAECGPPAKMFYDPYEFQNDPAVDGSVLYLSNVVDGVGIPATVLVYDVNGGSGPDGELFDPTVNEGVGVAVDSRHNLFWSTTNVWSGGGQVVEFRKGKMPGTVLRGTKIGNDTPGGVLIDDANDLLFIDQTTKTVNIYAPPYRAAPSSTISLVGGATYCALPRLQRAIYCLDNEYGAVDVYTYPKGKYLYSWTNGIDEKEAPLGIAIQQPSSGRD